MALLPGPVKATWKPLGAVNSAGLGPSTPPPGLPFVQPVIIVDEPPGATTGLSNDGFATGSADAVATKPNRAAIPTVTARAALSDILPIPRPPPLKMG